MEILICIYADVVVTGVESDEKTAFCKISCEFWYIPVIAISSPLGDAPVFVRARTACLAN